MFDLGLGSILGGVFGLAGGMAQNAANEKSVDKQIAFQDAQSRTQYQRATEDMRAAGINPMLAFSNGGNSSAVGASFNSSNVGEAAVRGLESGTNSAVKSTMVREQVKNMAADTDLKKANEKAASAAVVSSLANAQLANANSATVSALRPFQVDKANYEAGSAGNVYTAGNEETRYLNSPIGKLVRQLAYGGRDAADATSALKQYLPRFLR